jgi:hypothetical protein
VVLILRRYVSAPVWLAGLAGVFCALEPLQLLSERFVLSEPPALFFFALYAVFAFRYLKRGDFLSLAIMPPLAVASVSFRVAFLPCILFTAITLPLMSSRAFRLYGHIFKRTSFVGRPFHLGIPLALTLLQLALSVGLTVGELDLYKAWYGKLSNGPPAYIQADGFFLLSDVVPLVRAVDFPDPEMGRRVLSNVTVDLRDPTMRAAHQFLVGGLIPTLVREVNQRNRREDELRANEIARRVAISAAIHQPVAMAKLVGTNLGLYLDRANLLGVLTYDEYLDRPIDEGNQKTLRQVGFYYTRQPPAGPIVRWHYALWPWYMFLLAFPFVYSATVILTGSLRQPQFILLVAYSWAFLALAVVVTQQATPRFELPLAWLFPLAVGALFAHLARTPVPDPVVNVEEIGAQ